MSGMTVPGRAVQVLRLLDDEPHPNREARLLKLDTQVLRDITGKVDKEGHPLAVIVIAGPERQGKSFMLTYFVRYLQALEKSADGVVGDWMEKSNPEISMKDRGFNFENAFERTTEGIWMWSRPFVIPKPSNPDKKIAVLLMDTEGCYGSSLTNQEQAALVGLSLLTSSVFIYNETTRINDSTLATVGKFMQYGQLASQTFQGKIFHRIMFLIRDWNCPTIFEYGAAGGQGFIREFFREKPRMTKEAVEYRNAIMKHFEDCNAYLMPHPGQAVLSHKFAGSVAEMTPEFCYHVETVVTNLIADVGPKMLRDNPVTGSSFASLFQAYVNAFNASDMPSPASILKATLYIAFDTEIRSLIGSYESSLRNRMIDADNSGHMVTSQQLDEWGKKTEESIVSSFEKKEHRCAKEDKILYIERLKVEINRIHKKILEENESTRNKFIQRSAAAAYATFESFLENHVNPDDHYWKRPEFDALVNPAQEQCLKSLMKTCSSVPAEYLQPILTDLSDRMNAIKETLWTQLAARTAAAENIASEIIDEVLSEYISHLELLIGDDVQPETILEKFHNKQATSGLVSFKRRIETEFEDSKFVTESTENFMRRLEAEYMRFKEINSTKLNNIRGEFEGEIGEALALFKEESAKIMEDMATADQPTLKGIYESVLELALEALEDIVTPDSRLRKEYIRKLKCDLKASLDEAVATLVNSVEAKQLRCQQLVENAIEEFSRKLSSWIEKTGTVSAGTFEERSRELMRNELSKCEADMRLVIPEYANYLRNAQEVMERSRQDSAAANSQKLEETDRFALQRSQIITRSYEASLEKSLDSCRDLADFKKLHEEISSKFLSQFRLELESCKARNLYDSYEASCNKQIMESFNEKQHQFLKKTEGLEKLRTQGIPQRANDLRNRLEEKIKKNPFVSEADVDVFLQEEWPDVKHSLIREIRSELGLNSSEFTAVVDEIENHLAEIRTEVQQTLHMERDQGEKRAEAINQSVTEFAMTELSQVVELLLNGSRNNVEDDFQTLKAQVYSKFEDEWLYDPCSKKDSIKGKIYAKLDDEIDSARLKVLKKMNDETKLVAGSMNSVLSSFAKSVVEILDEGKHISIDKLDDLLKDEMEQKLEEFPALLLSQQVEPAKYMGEMSQQLKEKKRGLLQTNTENLEKIVTGAEGLIKTHYEESGTVNNHTSLDQLLKKTQTIVNEYLAENCDGGIDETLSTILDQSITEAHESLLKKLEGDAAEVLGTVSEDAIRWYGNQMHDSLETIMPIHPTQLKAYHDRTMLLVMKKLADKTFVSKNLEKEVENLLSVAYKTWVDQNNLRGGEDTNLAIGIDLGTTTLCVAIHRMKETRVIKDRSGRNLTPSFLFIAEDGSAIVGHEAKEQAHIYPEDTVFDAKRLIGRKFNDPYVQEDMKTWPFKVVEDVATKEPRIIIRGKPYRPEEVLAQQLRHMKNVVEEDLKEQGNIKKAVITVPANFNDRQRDATRQAAQIADLEVLQIINEPTAAAMAYAMQWKGVEKTVLVFDFGGGTLDVSILRTGEETAVEPEPTTSRGLVRAPKSEEIASHVRLHVLTTLGDTHLGGEDCDSNLVKFVAQKFQDQHNIDLLDSTVPQAQLKVKRIMRRLRNECELVKVRLTSADVATANLDAVAEDDQQNPLDLQINITKQEFEDMNDELFQKAVGVVAQALKEANLEKADIDEVLMVGGSSRIPRVREMLQDFMGQQALHLNQRIDIQEAVARGAAIQACIINGGSSVKGLPKVTDVQPFSLGIRERTGRMSVIIPRNTRIPSKATEQYTTTFDGQAAVDIEIFSGEDAMAENNVRLGEFTLAGIPADKKGEQLIDVSMEIDASGILNVTAVCISTGDKKNLMIKEDRGRLSDDQIVQLRNRFSPGSAGRSPGSAGRSPGSAVGSPGAGIAGTVKGIVKGIFK